jgi:hypothetical protein
MKTFKAILKSETQPRPPEIVTFELRRDEVKECIYGDSQFTVYAVLPSGKEIPVVSLEPRLDDGKYQVARWSVDRGETEKYFRIEGGRIMDKFRREMV